MPLSTSFIVALVVLAGVVRAQTAPNFAIPSSWNYTVEYQGRALYTSPIFLTVQIIQDISNYSSSDRAALAKDLVDTTLLNTNAPYNASDGIIDELGPEGNANFMSAVALLDHINGTKTYQSMVVGGLNTVMRLNTTASFPLWYGLTAVDAYRAYGDPTSLQVAETLWNLANQYVITPDDAAQGRHPVKTVPIASTCSGATTAGGVLDSFDPARSTDPTLKGYTTSSFAGLSAHLHELTTNSTYLAAATQTAQFVRAQLYNGAVIQDTMNMTDCTRVSATASFDSGFYIEALSVLATANGSWTPFLESLVSSAVPFSSWTGTDGINIEFASNSLDRWSQNSRSYLFRGLYSAWNRTGDPTSDMAKFIEAYVNTQFYGLQNFATSPGSNIYNTLWYGPPPGSFLDFGQVDAAWVLNSALGFSVRPNGLPVSSGNGPTTSSSSHMTSTTSTSLTSPTATPSPSHNKAVIRAAVGGTVGGLLLVFGISTIIVCYKRRRTRLLDSQLVYNAVPFGNEHTATMSYAHPQSSTSISGKGLGGDGVLAPLRRVEDGSNGSPAPHNPAASTTSYGSHNTGEDDVAALPALVARLTNIMARLPQAPSEAPPEYEARW